MDLVRNNALLHLTLLAHMLWLTIRSEAQEDSERLVGMLWLTATPRSRPFYATVPTPDIPADVQREHGAVRAVADVAPNLMVTLRPMYGSVSALLRCSAD